MQDAGVGVRHMGGDDGELQMLHELFCRLSSPLQAEGDDAAAAVRQIFLSSLIVFITRKGWIIDPAYFLPAFQELRDCLRMTTYIVSRIKVNEHILDDPRYDLMFSVEEVNRLASEGMPFRDAYKKVGLDIEAGKFQPRKEVHHTHEGSIGNLCNAQIAALMEEVWSGFNFGRMEEAEKKLLQ